VSATPTHDLERHLERQARELDECRAALRAETEARRAVERRLEQAEAGHRAFFVQNPLPMYIFDAETLAFLDVNEAAVESYGYGRDDFLSMTILDIRPDADVAAVEALARNMDEKRSQAGVWRHRRRDGGLIDVEVVTRSLTYAGRRARYVCPIDVTERRRAEMALRDAEAHFRALVEQSIAGIYIIEAGRMTYANPALCEITGYSPDEMLAMPLTDLVVAEDHAMLVELLDRREQGWRGTMVFDCRIRSKPGAIVHLHVESRMIDIAGNAVGVGVVRDVSAQVAADAALRSSESRFRELTENINEAFFLVDLQSQDVLYVSPAFEQIWGRACEEAYADRSLWTNSIHPEDREVALRAAELTNESGGFEFEYRIVRPDGEERWIHSRGRALRDEAGRAYRLAGVCADITRRKFAEAEVARLNASLERRVVERTAALEAANLELEAFDYSVSHDLKSPLRHITDYSSALMDEYSGSLDAIGRLYLERLERAGARLERMVSDLLGLSTLTRGDVYRSAVDVSALAEAVVADLRADAPSRDVEVSIQPGLVAHADAGLVHIALENLIGNAWKFTSRSPAARIEVGESLHGGRPVLHVRDNGAGFDMAFADKLFAPFRRLHKEDEFPGNGIGLATVQRIVRRHGGRIWPDAQLGRGATFRFTLAP
jgi:PAS domain S-box-containing protein